MITKFAIDRVAKKVFPLGSSERLSVSDVAREMAFCLESIFRVELVDEFWSKSDGVGIEIEIMLIVSVVIKGNEHEIATVDKIIDDLTERLVFRSVE